MSEPTALVKIIDYEAATYEPVTASERHDLHEGLTLADGSDMAERIADKILSSDWLSEHDRQVAERAWDEGAWMGHHLYAKSIQVVKAYSPYRAAKGEQK